MYHIHIQRAEYEYILDTEHGIKEVSNGSKNVPQIFSVEVCSWNIPQSHNGTRKLNQTSTKHQSVLMALEELNVRQITERLPFGHSYNLHRRAPKTGKCFPFFDILAKDPPYAVNSRVNLYPLPRVLSTNLHGPDTLLAHLKFQVVQTTRGLK
jgi:hypothetical protein